MSNLKRRIRQLEKKIDQDQATLQKNCNELKLEFDSPAFLITALVSGFATGYLIGHHRTSAQDKKEKGDAGYSLIKEIHSHVNLLLPLLFL